MKSDLGRWVIYALGGGLGHVTRALALARIAARKCPVTVLTNSEHVPFIMASEGWRKEACQLDLTVVQLRAADTTEGMRHEVDTFFLERSDVECLVVDTFPRGLVGDLVNILPRLQATKVLIARDLNPDYVERFAVTDFVESNFDMLLNPGEGARTTLPVLCGNYCYETEPWLIRSKHELAVLRHQMRCDLGVLDAESAGDQILLVVCASGNARDLAYFGSLTERVARKFPELVVRCLSPLLPSTCPPSLWISYWPGIEVIAAADVVLGAAGYNTLNECIAIGVPLICVPRRRLYDRQGLRASRATKVAATSDAALYALERLLETQAFSARASLSFENGAVEAFKQIHFVTQQRRVAER